MSKKFVWQCTTCGREYTSTDVKYLCPACSADDIAGQPPRGVLKAKYDYHSIIGKYNGIDLFEQLKKTRFLEILPIDSLQNLSGLAVGNTPLYRYEVNPGSDKAHSLYLKDDSQNPSYSYKDRASDLVSAWAREKGIKQIITASTGNAGSSMAAIGAAQKQRVIIIVPRNAPQGKLLQAAMYGAQIIPIEGSYDDAFELSKQATQSWGIYNRNTAYNPLTIEGKKSASLELYSQLHRQIPERIFVPVGDGCILAGIYKGWEDLLKLGIIEGLPQIIGVQSEKSSNFIDNLRNEPFSAQNPQTLADSISVKVPRNFYLAKQFITKYDGGAVKVSDQEILSAAGELAGRFGLFAEPAAAAAFAGYQKYIKSGWIEEHSRNVVLLTGSGLKDLNSYFEQVSLPAAIKPDMGSLKKMINLTL